ncbi:hypothetical protein, partial [Microbacterium sp. UMB0228]|uniref:hypothetical protein n=1 Tax=Microbacterium sp. UMB0228 TaxID=2029109 RepID=UPI001CA58DC4
MHTHAPVRRRTLEPHLIPVDNGVFDHARQELRPFSEDWVFLSKIQSVKRPGFGGGSQLTEDESHGSTEEVP